MEAAGAERLARASEAGEAANGRDISYCFIDPV